MAAWQTATTEKPRERNGEVSLLQWQRLERLTRMPTGTRTDTMMPSGCGKRSDGGKEEEEEEERPGK